MDDRVQVWYNPTLQSNFSLVPGVVCMITGNLTMILSALAIVREREIGTIEQLLVTPIKSWELMLGKLIPYMLMGFVNILIVLPSPSCSSAFRCSAAYRSCWPLRLFMVGSLGLGLLISTVSQTQMQASQLAGLILMPNMMLSGFMFPSPTCRRGFSRLRTFADALLPHVRSRDYDEGERICGAEG